MKKKSRRRSTYHKYKGRLPKHVKKFTYRYKGKKRTGYRSKITNRRISAGVIRHRKADQAIQERFPRASRKGIRNIKRAVRGYARDIKDMGEAERKVFEDRYKSLFKYLRTHAPEMLPEYQDLFDDEFIEDEDEGGDDDGS